MTDSITISSLKFECIIGVLPEERVTLQPVILDLEVAIDLAKAASSERLSDTLDYSEITQKVMQLFHAKKFLLLETAAYQTCGLLLSYKGVKKASVKLSKPLALSGLGVPSIKVTKKKGEA